MGVKTVHVELYKYHQRLVEDGLVVGTQGNISSRTKDGIIIKPSGVDYDKLYPDRMVKVASDGSFCKGLKPSTDMESHFEIYKSCHNVNSIVHTHSTFATAFAAHGLSIPVCLTSMADMFGGPIPCGGYAEIGGVEVGQAVVRNLTQAGVVLIQNHGLFSVGKTIKEAYKRALYAEDAAKTTYYAMMMGTPIKLSDERINSAFERYSNYGQ